MVTFMWAIMPIIVPNIQPLLDLSIDGAFRSAALKLVPA